MIDRINGPKISQDFDIKSPKSEHYKLSNGLDVYELNASTQPIIKLDFCILAGRTHEKNKAVARATIDLMKESTLSLDSDKLAEHFDFYGAEYYSSIDLDSSKFTLITLDKFLPEVLEAWVDIIFNPSFDKQDFEQHTSITAQKLKSQLSKNEVIAYREFTEKLFGDKHTYGYNTNPEDIQALKLEQCKDFYQRNIGVNNAALFVSGRISDKSRQIIRNTLERVTKSAEKPNIILPKSENPKGVLKYSQGQEHQVSLKLGAKLFDRKHEDFYSMYVVNTLLGGYFGSRLMTNIREDKGYCYNIYSGIDAMLYDGYWYVASDVGNDLVDKTISEIIKEIKVLQTVKVPTSELSMVKNYLQGHVMSLLDGPFASTKVIQGAWKYNLSDDYIEVFADEIRNISSKQVMELANKYFNLDNTLIVEVGKSLS